ncbi:MAG: hypothetical protein KDK30_18715 [Leptospiraceae bacterium]|nr:hypothetical protein [Leptospiraceae bacterium]
MTIYILFDASLGLHQTYAYGNSWGPRYLMPVVALMFIFIAGTGNLKGIRRASIMTLGIISSLLNYYLANLAFMPEPFTAPAALLKFGPEILAQNGGANLFTQSILVRRVLEAHPEHWNAFELLLRDIPALIGDPEKWSTFEYVKPVFGTPVFMSLLITISAPIAAVLVLVWAIKRNQVKTSSEN